jgi:hypothetical protein
MKGPIMLMQIIEYASRAIALHNAMFTEKMLVISYMNINFSVWVLSFFFQFEHVFTVTSV